jgi:hypothetical protein
MTDKLSNVNEQGGNLAVRSQSSVMDVVGASGVPMIPGVDQPFRFKFPRLGKIHLGVKAKAQSGAEYPVETPYFVLPDELLGNAKFEEALKACGNADPAKPTRLPIRLLSDSIGINISRSFDAYNTAHILLGRWDGFTYTYLDKKTGAYEQLDIRDFEGLPEEFRGVGHWIHRLKVVLPDAPGGIGYWQIDTPSLNNWGQLTTQMVTNLHWLKGKLGGVDLVLSREPYEFQTILKEKNGSIKKDAKGNAQIITRAHFLLNLRSELTIRELEEAAKTAVSVDSADIEDVDYSVDDSPVVDAVPEGAIADDGSFEVGDEEPIEAEVMEPEPQMTTQELTTMLKETFSNKQKAAEFMTATIGKATFKTEDVPKVGAALIEYRRQNPPKPADQRAMERLCILCNEVFGTDEGGEQVMRQWFGSEYGVESRKELSESQKADAIMKLSEMAESKLPE